MIRTCRGVCSSTPSAYQNRCFVTLGFVLLLVAPALSSGQVLAPTSSMNVGRAYFTLTRLTDGRVLAAGKKDTGAGDGDTAEIFDPTTAKWTPTGSMGQARGFHTATLLRNGKVLVAGGALGTAWTNTAELYDPATGTWTFTGSMSLGSYGGVAFPLKDGRVLVAGGYPNTRRAEIYDPATGQWSATGSMVHDRYFFDGTVLQDGRVLAAGGPANGTSSAEIFDPESGTWSVTGPLHYPRFNHSVTTLQDGRVLLVGGSDHREAEILDLATEAWMLTMPMPSARHGHSATLLLDGKVFITGHDARSEIGNSLLYDPAAEVWSPISGSSLNLNLAVRLLDGRVLVAGGTTDYNHAAGSPQTALFTGAAGAVSPVLTLELFAPPTLPVVDGTYGSNPFTITGRVTNIGAALAIEMEATVSLPPGLTLSNGAPTQAIDILNPGQSHDLAWNVRAEGQKLEKKLSYFVTLASSNAIGMRVTNQMLLPGGALTVNAVTPAIGGNSGIVTTYISGGGIADGATAKLVRPNEADVVATGIVVESNGSGLAATFDLSGRAVGLWGIVVTNPSGSAATFPDAFTIAMARPAETFVTFLAPTVVRSGRDTTIWLQYGNRGNVDAVGVFLWISIPSTFEWSFDFDFEAILPSDLAPVFSDRDWAQLPYYVDLGNETTIPVLIPLIPAGASGVLPVRIVNTKPGGEDLNVFRASVGAPLLQSSAPTIAAVDGLNSAAASAACTAPPEGCTQAGIDQLWADVESLQTRIDSLKANVGEYPDFEAFLAALAELESERGKKQQQLTSCLGVRGALRAIPLPHLPGPWWKRYLPTVIKGIAEFFYDKFGIPLRGCDDQQHSIRVVGSYDPNDKLGPSGPGSGGYLSDEVPLQYAVLFENLQTATAPAQDVVVLDRLRPELLEFSTFSLGPIAFGDFVVAPPPDLTRYTTDIDLRPRNNLIVRINADFDIDAGLATWRFTSLDPATMLPTEDPLAGFLPPNINSPEGQGSVLFTIMPKADLLTGTEIRNQASIVFDANAPILTPEWLNTIDNDPPSSYVAPTIFIQPPRGEFPVQWTGSDIGSGLQDYSIYVSDNGDPYTAFVANTTETSTTFHGQPGHTYSFYSVARDLVGNVEEAPRTPDWTVTTSACAANLTHAVAIRRGAFRFDRRTGRYSQTVSVANQGASAIQAPVSFVLDGLTAGATLANGIGAAGCIKVFSNQGSPYVNVSAGPDAVLSPGETATVLLQFANPTNGAIGYTPRVLAGVGER